MSAGLSLMPWSIGDGIGSTCSGFATMSVNGVFSSSKFGAKYMGTPYQEVREMNGSRRLPVIEEVLSSDSIN